MMRIIMKHVARPVLLCMALLFLASGLAACGKKARPTPPQGSTYPRQYPKPPQPQ